MPSPTATPPLREAVTDLGAVQRFIEPTAPGPATRLRPGFSTTILIESTPASEPHSSTGCHQPVGPMPPDRESVFADPGRFRGCSWDSWLSARYRRQPHPGYPGRRCRSFRGVDQFAIGVHQDAGAKTPAGGAGPSCTCRVSGSTAKNIRFGGAISRRPSVLSESSAVARWE